MRIFIHDYAGHPPQVHLSRELARRGHTVLHSYSADIQTPRGALERRPEDPAGFAIRGLSLGKPISKDSLVVRQFQEIKFGRCLRDAARAFRPDVVVLANTPLASLQSVQSDCRKRGVPFVFWLMDVYSVAVHKILKSKLPVVGDIIGRGYDWLERQQLRNSDRVILISEGFSGILDDWGVDPTRIEVMPLWAPLEEMSLRAKDNPWSRRQGVADTINIVYSGTLGLKHNPSALSDLALKYKDRDDIRVIVISEGLGASYLAKAKQDHGLDNLVLLPFQPFEDLPDVLGAADVVVTLLEPDAGTFSCPSKVLTYLCAGRAQVGAIPADNRAAKVIRESGGGITVSPLDRDAFLAAVDRLIGDADARARFGQSARAYAEREFDIRRLGDEFEGYLRLACGNAALSDDGSRDSAPA